tara:strand:- start:53453 stop:53854 length:402 start_codon:yes stop_codon:yes gene_type:complete
LAIVTHIGKTPNGFAPYGHRMLYKNEPTVIPLMEAMHLIDSDVCTIEWTTHDLDDSKLLEGDWHDRLCEILNLNPKSTVKQIETILKPKKDGRKVATKAKPIELPTMTKLVKEPASLVVDEESVAIGSEESQE